MVKEARHSTSTVPKNNVKRIDCRRKEPLTVRRLCCHSGEEVAAGGIPHRTTAAEVVLGRAQRPALGLPLRKAASAANGEDRPAHGGHLCSFTEVAGCPLRGRWRERGGGGGAKGCRDANNAHRCVENLPQVIRTCQGESVTVRDHQANSLPNNRPFGQRHCPKAACMYTQEVVFFRLLTLLAVS